MTQHIEEARKLAKDYAVLYLEEVASKVIAAALAAAEERGRSEERERSASKTAGVGVETDPVLVGEIVEAGTAAAQLLYGRDVIFHEQLQRMPVGTKLYAAIKGGEQ